MTFLKSITQEIAIVIVIFALFGLMFYAGGHAVM
ncbi:hypothetical protein QRX56_03915, partial [Staphylococcus aureus]